MNAHLKAIYTDRKPCIVLGVTGGIAAYKSCELLRSFQKEGIDVFVVMTKNATQFIAPLTFETLSGHPVALDTFIRPETWEVEHIALAKRADLFLIAPATANMLAKIAHGIADDMLSTTVLATKAPVLVAPAMNAGMYQNAATQENLNILRKRGIHIIGPESGMLACGDVGVGRLADINTIKESALELLTCNKDLSDVKITVTAGPTQEAIDPVRYITNRSSGKMGYALARAAYQRGAKVTLVSGPVSLQAPYGVECIRIKTTEELFQSLIKISPEQDVIIQAAAPADFRMEFPEKQKIKKDGSGKLRLELTENTDIAAAIGKIKTDRQILIGFAAETDNVTSNAIGKMKRKKLDLIVANDVTKEGAGFDVDTNIVTLITENESKAYPILSKEDVANCILDWVADRMRKG